MSEELNAFLDGVYVGAFAQSASGTITFRYDDGYRGGADPTPLSLSMPTVVAEHRSRVARPFLAGLLPDSATRLDELARYYRVSPRNPFALLSQIGRDAAGAIQLLPPGFDSPDAARRRGAVDVLSPERFDELIADLVANAASWGRRGDSGRWSLPGAQPKVALFRTRDGKWAVPTDSTPTTHILKPAVAPYSEHHVNEFVTMSAARRLGLTVADDTMLRTDRGDRVLVSARYDRAIVDGRWHRLHQEDVCQALAVMPERKYQQDGGPGIGEIGQLFRRLPDPQDRAENARAFFTAIVFNVSALGTDAHAKNYSLLLRNDRATLAPLYDLGTHAPYPLGRGESFRAAMSVGSEYRIDAIGTEQLLFEAQRLGLPQDESRDIIARIRTSLAEAFADAAGDAAREFPDGGGLAERLATTVAAYARGRGWTS